LGANWSIQGLRGLGWGATIRVAAADVALTTNAAGTLQAAVNFANVTAAERIRTVVYQGEVVDSSITGNAMGGMVTVVKPAFSA
jgi:hypothetical protein